MCTNVCVHKYDVNMCVTLPLDPFILRSWNRQHRLCEGTHLRKSESQRNKCEREWNRKEKRWKEGIEKVCVKYIGCSPRTRRLRWSCLDVTFSLTLISHSLILSISESGKSLFFRFSLSQWKTKSLNSKLCLLGSKLLRIIERNWERVAKLISPISAWKYDETPPIL